MKKYILYTVKNISQLRKSQVNIKLNKNMRNAAKKHIIKANLLEKKDVNSENKAEDRKSQK